MPNSISTYFIFYSYLTYNQERFFSFLLEISLYISILLFMKHQTGKIKTEHHIMKEFLPFLKELEKLPKLKRIIPWRISRKQSWTSKKHISISYITSSGMKLQLKKWSTAQECFITCNAKDIEYIQKYINTLI